MWIKRLGIGITAIGFLLASSGCVYNQNGSSKKIILTEDVREVVKKETAVEVKVQQIELDLGGGYFNPAYYYNGEVYGSVGKGSGVINLIDSMEYPVGGSLKDRLYSLDKNNILKETTKKVFAYPYSSKVINHENYTIVSIDYLNENEPRVMPELDEALSKIGPYDNLIIKENIIDGNKKMLTILNSVPDKGFALYFYDVEKKKLYTRKGNVVDKDSVGYLPALKSFINVDEDYKCYKVVFEEDTYDFKEYIDLKGFVKKDEASKNMVQFIPINEEEVLLMELSRYSNYNYETKRISTFNFTTNKYEQLFTADDTEHLHANYIGKVESVGDHILLIDTFIEDKGHLHYMDYIRPKERYFKKIEGGQLVTFYKEDISSEGLTLQSTPWIAKSENGEEIFLKKEVLDIENNVGTAKAAIYKRYIFK
jgi:hypothetical protein